MATSMRVVANRPAEAKRSIADISRKGLIEEFEDIEDSDFEKEITLHLDSTSDPMGEFYSAIEFLYNSGLLR